MKVSKFGITLRTVQKSDLEIIRDWRNSDSVRLNMRYQKFISAEDQAEWFSALDPNNNVYFVIEYRGIAVGVCNLKEIDWKSSQGEGGIFIGVQKYLGTSVPVRAILLASLFFCDLLHIDRINISIVAGNVTAVKFNAMLGAVVSKSSDGIISMYFDRSMFHAATASLIRDFELRSEPEMIVCSESMLDQKLLESRLTFCDHEFLTKVKIQPYNMQVPDNTTD